MSANRIILPVDTGNSGKRVRTNERTVAAEQVHEHYFIPTSVRQKTGVFLMSTGIITVVQTAHTSLQGFAWLINPTSSTIWMAIRRIEGHSITQAAAAVATRIAVERVTFTGTPSGTLLNAIKRQTSDAGPQGVAATTSTGLTLSTVSSNAPLYAFLMTASIGSVYSSVPSLLEWEPDEDGMLVLAPGEGIVLRQPDAGVASDPRRAVFNIGWEEYTL